MFLDEISRSVRHTILKELSFRSPAPVLEIRCFREPDGLTGYPVCPRCGITMEREYQHFCDRCGQKLDWEDFDRAIIIMPE